MVRHQRLSQVPSPAEISRMLDADGITDANTAWGFRRGLTYAISKGASLERAIEYARKHCDDVKTISNTPDQYPQLTADENIGNKDGVTSFSALLKNFRDWKTAVLLPPSLPKTTPQSTTPTRKGN